MNDRGNEYAAFAVRATLGAIFFLHGLYNVFGLFGGPGISGFTDRMHGLVSVAPTLTGIAVGVGGLLAGTALILGCFHRIAAVCALLILAGALYFLHRGSFFLEHQGFEYDLALMAMAAAILMGGPGAFAYRVEFKKNDKPK